MYESNEESTSDDDDEEYKDYMYEEEEEEEEDWRRFYSLNDEGNEEDMDITPSLPNEWYVGSGVRDYRGDETEPPTRKLLRGRKLQ
mmetsp:Transcript_12484/g.35736  ORF Transcript_12484/g.35736 Transcript_12484/m.35736 type:complete len:86 (-) Transcript_12484:79-336(-)